MKFAKIAALAAALTAGAALAAPAVAGTFAEFQVPASATFPSNFFWNQTGSTSGTLTTFDAAGNASTPVEFTFLGVPGFSSSLAAILTFNGAVTNSAATGTSFLVQDGLAGSFEFTYAGTTPLVVNGKTYATGADLLSGTFSKADIAGQNNASAGFVGDATTAGDVLNLKSDFLTFGSGQESYSISLTSIDPGLSAASGSSLNSFTGVGTGSFEASLSTGGGAGGVPEPATWAMVIFGMAAIGASLRRRTYSLVPA